MMNAKSIDEISHENLIPISTCYRRVRELVNLRLLKIEKIVITDIGKKYETYRSAVKSVTVRLVSGELWIDVATSDSPEERLRSMWNYVRQKDEPEYERISEGIHNSSQ